MERSDAASAEYSALLQKTQTLLNAIEFWISDPSRRGVSLAGPANDSDRLAQMVLEPLTDLVITILNAQTKEAI